MDVVLCSGIESIHKGVTNDFKSGYSAANFKYCPQNFEEFFIQPDV